MTKKLILAAAGLGLALSCNTMAKEPQPNDKRHGEGKGHPVQIAREAEPNDPRHEPQPGRHRLGEPNDKRHGEGKGHPFHVA